MRCNKCNQESEGDICSNCGEKMFSTKGKLLGFRSNKRWKKAISVIYMVFLCSLFVTKMSAGRQGQITVYDFLVDKVYSMIVCLMLLAPYLALSNTKIRDKLPLFRRHTKGTSAVGMIILLFSFMTVQGIVNSMHSAEYLADMEDHAYVIESNVDASCTENGKISYYCTYCARTKDETIPANGHVMVEKSRVDPTCASEGSVSEECSECEYTNIYELERTPHTWMVVEDIQSTCTENGSKVNECSACGETERLTVEKLEHVMHVEYVNDATSTSPKQIHKKCNNCSYTETEIVGEPVDESKNATDAESGLESENSTSNEGESAENWLSSIGGSIGESLKGWLGDILQDAKPDSNANTKDDTTEGKEISLECLTDDLLKTRFLEVCEETHIDPSEIVGFTQVDDWVGGSRYSFSYEGLSLYLYCNMDGTIENLRVGRDIDIYKRGYEPYSVYDYTIDSYVEMQLEMISEDIVKSQLNYPATAKFSLFGWGFTRDRDIYTVVGDGTAKNAFGVEQEFSFLLKFYHDKVNDKALLKYFVLNGSVLANEMDDISYPERKKIETEDDTLHLGENNENEIVLEYGNPGEYGKTILVDGEECIVYHIPAGEYIVTSKVNRCVVFVCRGEYYANEYGYMENEIVEELRFSSYDESKKITIKDGEYLELTIYAEIMLTLAGE